MKSFSDLPRRTFRRAVASRPVSARNKAKLAVTLLEDRTVPATIEGTIFYDANGDGSQDGGENYAEGIGVMLSNTNGTSSTGSTDSLGHYVFSGVSPGSYTVIVTGAPTGYTVSGNGGVSVVNDTDDISVGFGLEGGGGSGSGSSSTASEEITVQVDVTANTPLPANSPCANDFTMLPGVTTDFYTYTPTASGLANVQLNLTYQGG